MRRIALTMALMLLGSVWTMSQVAGAQPRARGASSPAYPLKISANGRYLVDQNNIPFLITGDNPHALLGMGSIADAESYFANRQAHGFDAVWMNLLVATPAYYDSRDDGSAPDGIRPFTSYIAGGTDSAHYDLTKVSSRQDWKSSGAKVPVPSIACIQTVNISGACGGNDARSART
jgi:hypothetical protein